MKIYFTILSILLFLFQSSVNLFANPEESIHWNNSRGYKPFKYATPDGILITNPTDSLRYDYFEFPDPSKSMILSFRSKNMHGKPEQKYEYFDQTGKRHRIRNPHWGFFITTQSDTLVTTFTFQEGEHAMAPSPETILRFYRNNQAQNESVILKDEINPYEGDNIWTVVMEKGFFRLQGGDHGLKNLYSSKFKENDITGFGFLCGWGGEIFIQDINLKLENPGNDRFKNIDILNLADYLKNTNDPMEGYWGIFDRELEESLLKLGGDYRLACVKDNDEYIFLYIDGATINKERWEKGDLKARLSNSFYPGIYNVEWFDSMKEPISNEIKAQKGEGNTLTIQFPYQSSKIRLRKIQ